MTTVVMSLLFRALGVTGIVDTGLRSVVKALLVRGFTVSLLGCVTALFRTVTGALRVICCVTVCVHSTWFVSVMCLGWSDVCVSVASCDVLV